MPIHFLQLQLSTGRVRHGNSRDERNRLEVGDYVKTTAGEVWQVTAIRPLALVAGLEARDSYICVRADRRQADRRQAARRES